MDNLGLSPEDHHERFRDSQITAVDQLFMWSWKLNDTAVRWLQPRPSEGNHHELVVLQQFVEGLPREMARWVCSHRSASLEAAVTLAEDHLTKGAESHSQPATRPQLMQALRQRLPDPSPVERSLMLHATNHFLPGLLAQALECWKECARDLKRECLLRCFAYPGLQTPPLVKEGHTAFQ